MGIYDRDYYRNPGGNAQLKSWAMTAVGAIILLNVGCWFLQLITRPGPGAFSTVGQFMSASGNSIFGGGFPELWRLVTACFAHSESSIWHIVFNMLIFWVCGRELERIYGRREFLIFYLFAGTLAVLIESFVQFQQGSGRTPILGASGGVMGVMALYICHYPKRTWYIYFLIPVPAWLLGCLVLWGDLSGAVGHGNSGVANFAHLAGAGWGVLYKFFDLRWSTLRQRFGGGSRRRKKETRSQGSGSLWKGHQQKDEKPRVPDAVSRRVDELLEKIHQKGMGSLSDEEREFLVENSRRYRKS